MHICFHAG